MSPLSEFSLIQRYFTRDGGRGAGARGVTLGIGDDAALLRPPPGMELAVTVDTLVAGVHFPPEAGPAEIGHKALAVNLSDLAAMGADPAWCTLALTLPEADAGWLEGFSDGLFALAEHFGIALVGGDTTRGPLSVTLQAIGWVPQGAALRRDGAQPGDGIYVTGTVGEAALALALLQGHESLAPELEGDREVLMERLHRPWPRVMEGGALRGLAGAAIDISDGVAADLGHILTRSGVGATLELERLPMPAWGLPEERRRGYALSGGDDYELLFTLPEGQREALERRLGGVATRIGVIEPEPGLRCVDGEGRIVAPEAAGYTHF